MLFGSLLFLHSDSSKTPETTRVPLSFGKKVAEKGEEQKEEMAVVWISRSIKEDFATKEIPQKGGAEKEKETKEDEPDNDQRGGIGHRSSSGEHGELQTVNKFDVSFLQKNGSERTHDHVSSHRLITEQHGYRL